MAKWWEFFTDSGSSGCGRVIGPPQNKRSRRDWLYSRSVFAFPLTAADLHVVGKERDVYFDVSKIFDDFDRSQKSCTLIESATTRNPNPIEVKCSS